MIHDDHFRVTRGVYSQASLEDMLDLARKERDHARDIIKSVRENLETPNEVDIRIWAKTTRELDQGGMKRYLAFAWECWEAEGGWNEFMGSFDTKSEAIECAKSNDKYTERQVVDSKTGLSTSWSTK